MRQWTSCLCQLIGWDSTDGRGERGVTRTKAEEDELRRQVRRLKRVRMLLWLSVCVCALVSTNGLERELVSKQVSSSDLELFSFAEVALKEYFRGESPIRLTSISRLTQFVSVLSRERERERKTKDLPCFLG